MTFYSQTENENVFEINQRATNVNVIHLLVFVQRRKTI